MPGQDVLVVLPHPYGVLEGILLHFPLLEVLDPLRVLVLERLAHPGRRVTGLSHHHLGFQGRYVSLNGPGFYPRVPQCFFGSYASHYVYYIQWKG